MHIGLRARGSARLAAAARDDGPAAAFEALYRACAPAGAVILPGEILIFTQNPLGWTRDDVAHGARRRGKSG